MDRLKRVWGTFRRWPLWVQVPVAGLVILFVSAAVAAPFTNPDRKVASTTSVAPTTVPTTTATTTAPPPAVPPDLLDPAVTSETIASTICAPGYTATVRPVVSVTDALKRAQIVAYGYTDRSTANYEEDHVIPLELGGAPAAQVNLFPEPHAVSGADDSLENDLHARVCGGALPLAAAQAQVLAAKVSHGYDRERSLAGGAARTTTTQAPAPRAVPGSTSAPTPTEGSGSTGVYYANCAAVRAAGVAPLTPSSPGYRSALDTDHDGLACE